MTEFGKGWILGTLFGGMVSFATADAATLYSEWYGTPTTMILEAALASIIFVISIYYARKTGDNQ